jgi:hypothetical protein
VPLASHLLLDGLHVLPLGQSALVRHSTQAAVLGEQRLLGAVQSLSARHSTHCKRLRSQRLAFPVQSLSELQVEHLQAAHMQSFPGWQRQERLPDDPSGHLQVLVWPATHSQSQSSHWLLTHLRLEGAPVGQVQGDSSPFLQTTPQSQSPQVPSAWQIWELKPVLGH